LFVGQYIFLNPELGIGTCTGVTMSVNRISDTINSLTLDLTKISDRRIQDIEVIDITGSGDNTLKLNLDDLFPLGYRCLHQQQRFRL
jgi:hypothetical protein